jgi:hypothetical protein
LTGANDVKAPSIEVDGVELDTARPAAPRDDDAPPARPDDEAKRGSNPAGGRPGNRGRGYPGPDRHRRGRRA